MKKKYRLVKGVDFRELLSVGDKFLTSSFICYWMKCRVINSIKIGLIIPKKKCALSWKRKYLKRVFWALNAQQDMENFPKVKCVFFYRDYFYKEFNNGKISFQNLKQEYLGVINRIREFS